jgi:RNA polymerase sigma-70 factor (ECF subfamily)
MGAWQARSVDGEGWAEDRPFLIRLRQGDRAALEALRAKYGQPVLQTALAITRDQALAETIQQECFDRLGTEARRLDAEAPLSPWLYRLAIDLSQAGLSAPGSGWTLSVTALDRLDRLFAPGLPPARRDLTVLVEQAIEALPRHQRVVMVLYYLGGLRLKEIAQILACPVGTVKSRLHYGREALHRKMTRF